MVMVESAGYGVRREDVPARTALRLDLRCSWLVRRWYHNIYESRGIYEGLEGSRWVARRRAAAAQEQQLSAS
jgi:hypothetical protein